MDLLVVPSIAEGMSNVVLEAMACGIPALVNQICGHGEIIKNGVNGFIEDLSTEEKLCKNMRRCIELGPQLQGYGSRARSSIVRHFSLSRMVETYARLYLAISSSPR